MRTFDAQADLYARNFAAADSIAGGVLKLDSTFLLAKHTRAEALLGLGRTADAIRIMEQLVASVPPSPATEYHGFLAYAYARARDSTRARSMLERMRVASGGHLPPMGLVAVTLDELGDTDAAVAALTRARDLHDPWLPGFVMSERYDRLRKDPRGATILATVLTR